MTNVLIRAEYPDQSAMELDIELTEGTPFTGVNTESVLEYLKDIVPNNNPVRIIVNGDVIYQAEVRCE